MGSAALNVHLALYEPASLRDWAFTACRSSTLLRVWGFVLAHRQARSSSRATHSSYMLASSRTRSAPLQNSGQNSVKQSRVQQQAATVPVRTLLDFERQGHCTLHGCVPAQSISQLKQVCHMMQLSLIKLSPAEL